jgi:membrane-bound serine protease (ClpP class)
VIIPVVTAAAGLSLAIVGMGVRAMRRRPLTGREGMVGLTGVAKTALAPQGQILVRGEIWDARSTEPIEPGTAVQVTRMEGLKLHVKPAASEESRP